MLAVGANYFEEIFKLKKIIYQYNLFTYTKYLPILKLCLTLSQLDGI